MKELVSIEKNSPNYDDGIGHCAKTAEESTKYSL